MVEEQEAGPGRPRGVLIGLGPWTWPERNAGPTRKRVPGWAGLRRAEGMGGRGEAGLGERGGASGTEGGVRLAFKGGSRPAKCHLSLGVPENLEPRWREWAWRLGLIQTRVRQGGTGLGPERSLSVWPCWLGRTLLSQTLSGSWEVLVVNCVRTGGFQKQGCLLNRMRVFVGVGVCLLRVAPTSPLERS